VYACNDDRLQQWRRSLWHGNFGKACFHYSVANKPEYRVRDVGTIYSYRNLFEQRFADSDDSGGLEFIKFRCGNLQQFDRSSRNRFDGYNND